MILLISLNAPFKMFYRDLNAPVQVALRFFDIMMIFYSLLINSFVVTVYLADVNVALDDLGIWERK